MMITRLILCRFALLLLFFFPLTASASAWDSFVGHESCEFVAGQIEEDNEIATLIIAAFITGSNYATGRSVDTDLDAMVTLVRDYCTGNPSERFLDALIHLDSTFDAPQESKEP
jgi:hypothetical protein